MNEKEIQKLCEIFQSRIREFKWKHSKEWEKYKSMMGIDVSSWVRFSEDGSWNDDFVHVAVQWPNEDRDSYYSIPKQIAELSLVLGYMGLHK